MTLTKEAFARLEARLSAFAEQVNRINNGALPDAMTWLPQDAADLTAALAEIRALEEGLIETAASLAAAISLLERTPKTVAPSNKMFCVMLNDYRASLKRARALLQESKT